jgi:hypothetical protein
MITILGQAYKLKLSDACLSRVGHFWSSLMGWGLEEEAGGTTLIPTSAKMPCNSNLDFITILVASQ